MPHASESDQFIHFKGGLVLPMPAVMLALDLEARGCRMRTEGADLLVTPHTLLTDEDVRALKRWKHHIMALVSYEPPTLPQ